MHPGTLHRISGEHRCLLALADAIDAALARGAEPDYGALRELAGALQHNFIEVHLPRERLVVDRLLAGSGAARALLATFMNDHGLAFLDDLVRFTRALDALLVDQIVDRERLREHGHQATAHLRAQIAAEENATLPWAAKSLGQRDWGAIESGARALPARCDMAGHATPRADR